MGKGNAIQALYFAASDVFDHDLARIDRFSQGDESSYRQRAIDLQHDDGETTAMEPGGHTRRQVASAAHNHEWP
jgi:hypothetical protein